MTNKIIYFPTVERQVSDPVTARELFFLDQEIKELTAVIPQSTEAIAPKAVY